MMNSLHKTLIKTSSLRFYALSFSFNYHTGNFPSLQPIQAQDHGTFTADENPKIDGDIPGSKNLKRPSEIPFQPKVANRVNFIGSIRVPVKFVTSADGKSWAGTVISQDQSKSSSNMPRLWIPIIFEGDLAHVAATHLKILDTVHVTGQLSREILPIDLKNDKVDCQVKVHDIHFVRGYPAMKKYTRK